MLLNVGAEHIRELMDIHFNLIEGASGCTAMEQIYPA